MSLLRGYDSAFPVADPPAWDVCLFYIGGVGLTPHVWTDEEIQAQPVTFLDPTWVCRLNAAADTGDQGIIDARLAVNWLQAHGVPAGSLMTLDTETLILPEYISAFDQSIQAAGYKCKNYGSLSYVTRNPLTSGGRHSADWRDIPELDPAVGVVATQFANAAQLGTDYDGSVYEPGLSLWVKPGANPGLPAYEVPSIASVTQYLVLRVGINPPASATDATVYHYQLADETGKLVADDRVPGPSFTIDAGIHPGHYMLRLAAGQDDTHLASQWSAWKQVS